MTGALQDPSPRKTSPIGYVDLEPAVTDFRAEVLAGLQASRKWLPPKFFYDERGSALFERITELDEYYPTRTEIAILERHASEMTDLFGDDFTLIEFGSGSSRKVRILLDAADRAAAYMPIDISGDFLRESAQSLADEYPSLRVTAVCADYTHLTRLPSSGAKGRRVVFFPGSTIGNLEPDEASRFLRDTAGLLAPGDGMLIGVDLVKDHPILDAAYNDAAGVTAEFNLNLLARINRELGADFDLDAFEHLAFFDPDASRIEMHLRSLREQTVHIAGEEILFVTGETIHTENSYKYGEGRFRELVEAAGFTSGRRWTDPREWFSVHWLEVSNSARR